jgi:hypothetical protein
MFKLVDALFGCPHKHCTFPITSTKPGHASATYVVCLDCGREFPYDWERMKVVSHIKQHGQAVA